MVNIDQFWYYCLRTTCQVSAASVGNVFIYDLYTDTL